jgi:glycerophosphoryl diester phosphodiesterase
MHLNDIYRGQTLVLGHRGASAYAPMNTLPAFELAVAQGADGVELDVHLSQDGHLVVLHDFTVDHTTDGTGRAKDMPLAQLKELDAGAKFDSRFAGTRIPTLDEVFEAVGAHLRLINVEIKSEDMEQTDGVEQEVANCIARHKLERSVLVSSFNPYALRRFRAIKPEVAIGCLYVPDGSMALSLMGETTFEALHPYHLMIDATYMTNARQTGRRVNTWTVNEPARAAELAQLGVDAIITDTPDSILKVVRA